MLHRYLLRYENRDIQHVLRIEYVRTGIAQTSGAALQEIDQFSISRLLNQRHEVPKHSHVLPISLLHSILLVTTSELVRSGSRWPTEDRRDRVDHAIAVDSDVFRTSGDDARDLST